MITTIKNRLNKMHLYVNIFYLVFLVVIQQQTPITQARRVAPLLEDDLTRRPHRPAECMFGKQIRELGSTWHADLGPPFGVMYCIRCECVPIQKKRRIVARTQCRNIKNECPKPTCEEPVLLPGRCCKTCPGDYSPDIAQDVPPQITSDEEERSLKHFATLLTGKTSLPLRRDDLTASSAVNNAYNYVATGRFNFHRKNLYYSFYLSSSTPRPRSIQFIDISGNILEEQTLNPIGGVYQNATGKLCGVWRRVPRDYRKLLREEHLHVALTWEPSATLTGQLSRYRALSTEQFSALLEPQSGVNRSLMLGAGGTAIVSASGTTAPSVHVLIVFNGVFSPSEISEVPITVELGNPEKKYVILREDILVSKPSHEINIGEVRSALSVSDLRLLARGKLAITISSKGNPQALSLQGTVGPRATCDLYQTLLTSEAPSSASGLAWAFLDRIGSLRYGVQLVGLEEESPLVTLVDDGGKRRTELEDLTPSLVSDLANGSVERPGLRLLEPLFSGELSVVAASHVGSLLRGRLTQKLVADARDTPSPILLRRVDPQPVPSGLVGLVWATVDLDCTLHYELEISGGGIGADRTLQLYLETMPLLAQGAPVARRLLEEFTGSFLEGSVTGLSSVELYRIESGISYLEVRDRSRSEEGPLLKAPFRTRTPLSCLPHYADNDVAGNMQPPKADAENSACYHETRFFEEGTQWTAKSDVCTMCHCRRGLTSCDAVPCPAISCPVGQMITNAKGHCCPVCAPAVTYLNETQNNLTSISLGTGSRGCVLAGQYHLAGASWHPYVPPAGFDTCAVCSCDVLTLEVKCPRVQCPPLDCDEKLAIRPDKKACCRQCPAPKNTGIQSGGELFPRDQATVTSRPPPEQILASGGCKYPMVGPVENGKEWHPRIHSHGEMKCVKCRCKDGEVKCERKRCPRSLCNSIARQRRQGGVISEIDDCCSTQCRRARRHRQHHPKRAARRELKRS